MKLGGLFSGVGGFELAWTQLGHEFAWMCEIDKSARKVLEERFPGVPIYENVEDLDPAEVEAVDVLTGGSPCQGFSVAGHRTGLEHGESRLFSDYVRIMEGLANRGLKWALWENVPGVLSIQNDDGERTFEHVVAALVGGTEPVRLPDGNWGTGLADGPRRAVAWRVLDSRHFGVAQRRRRVFACVSFGDSPADRAGRALLAKSEGVQGDSESGGKAGEAAARRFAPSAGAAGGFRMTAFGEYEDDDSASTLKERDYKDATDLIITPKMLFVRGGVDVDRHGRTAGKGPLLTDDESATLDSGNHWTLFQPDQNEYGVRRLTPVECERLQGFPDGWTEPAKSDSARFRAMGNAVTVNTVRWILGRMLNVE
jgi:DNA (cytosine-5)-methyltransferase 1